MPFELHLSNVRTNLGHFEISRQLDDAGIRRNDLPIAFERHIFIRVPCKTMVIICIYIYTLHINFMMYEGKKTNKEERRTNRLHPNQLNINVQ